MNEIKEIYELNSKELSDVVKNYSVYVEGCDDHDRQPASLNEFYYNEYLEGIRYAEDPTLLIERHGSYNDESTYVWVSYRSDINLDEVLSWDEFRYDDSHSRIMLDLIQDEPYRFYCEYLEQFGFKEARIVRELEIF